MTFNAAYAFEKAIKEVKRLRKREYRRATGLVIVEGYPEVKRAVKAGVKVRTMYICPDIFTPQPNEFEHASIVEVPVSVFAKMAFGDRLKGILALCEGQQYGLSDLQLSDNPLIVVLEGVEKPGNLGAVLRTCDGAGVDAVILCDGKTDIYNQHVVRSSIGTVFTVPTAAASKEETRAFLKQHNIQSFIASAKGQQSYTDSDFSKSSAIIVGHEHHGVSPFWFEQSYQTITIPMLGDATCLNVAVSASILIYESFRQRRYVRAGSNCLEAARGSHQT